MIKQIKSFSAAFRGLFKTMVGESHMRFHITAAFYVLVFSFFYDFSPLQWAVLVITIAVVLTLEVVNTCIEQLCDFVSDRYEPRIRFIKDAAAGAVLIAAIAAVVVAILLFWNTAVFAKIISFFACEPLRLVPLAISAVISVLFVWRGTALIKR